MGCLAGIVEAVGRTTATTPGEFENGGEGRAGPGARGRLERAGKLRCGVSFNFIFIIIKTICFPGAPGGSPCARFFNSMM